MRSDGKITASRGCRAFPCGLAAAGRGRVTSVTAVALVRMRVAAGRMRVAAAAALGLLLPAAAAQFPVAQDGRYFDANPQVGASRFYDYGSLRPSVPLLSGNLLASGNVRGGLSLRSFSPIPEGTSLRVGLGSASLSSFIRDSVSVSDVSSPYAQFRTQPFFDPARTAPTGAFLQGQYGLPGSTPAFGSATPAPRAPLPGLLNYAPPIDARIDTSDPLGRLTDVAAVPPTVNLQSSIFGVNAPVQNRSNLGDRSLTDTPQGIESAQRDFRVMAGIDPDRPEFSRPNALAQPLDFRVPNLDVLQPPSARLDVSLETDPLALLGDNPFVSPGRFDSSAGEDPREAAAPPAGIASQQPGLTGASPSPAGLPEILPGRDLFTDMRMALSLERDPGATWYSDMRQAVENNPAAANQQVPNVQMLESQEFVNEMLGSPLTSFATQSPTAINREIRQAESLLDEGRYMDAVEHYERARVLDPHNPLPLIGKGHAMIAAGDYFSAALSLISGLERFPEISRFNVDLKEMMGGAEVIDIRRSDIHRQLEMVEDPHLRFLLGYLEYHSGDRERGMANLKKAAMEAQPGSIIRRYPDLLEGRGALPPPKLPSPQIPAAPPPGEPPDEGGQP